MGASVLAHAATDLSSFETILSVQRNGSVVVVEHIAPAVSNGHFFWSTSAEFPGTWSIHQPRVVQILQVTTPTGRPIPYTANRTGTHLEIEIQSPPATEIRIVYSVANAISFQRDHERMLWSPGAGWRGNIADFSLFLEVPPEAGSDFRAQAFIKGRPVSAVSDPTVGPDRVQFRADNVSKSDALMIDVALPPGVIHEASAVQKLGWFVRANSIVLLPLVVLFVMLALRHFKSLPDESSGTIVPRYEPPVGLTPAEVGVLVDDCLDPRDVTATIIDLAIRKYIRLEPGTPDEGVDFTQQDFVLRLLRPINEWQGLAPHEQTVLFHTFYGGHWTKLSSLTLRFYSVVPTLKSQLLVRLRMSGYYWLDPQHAPLLRLANLLVLIAVLYILQAIGIFRLSDSWLLSLLAILGSGIIVHSLGRRISAKTRKGLRAYQEIRGFREFLQSVEQDRLERIPAELFERCLPYAMALGVEHHWATAFAGMALGPPEWFGFEHPELFNTERLARVLDVFSRRTAQTLSVKPRGAISGQLRTTSPPV
jgi:hypothetical protein